jgi:hypothetical protein
LAAPAAKSRTPQKSSAGDLKPGQHSRCSPESRADLWPEPEEGKIEQEEEALRLAKIGKHQTEKRKWQAGDRKPSEEKRERHWPEDRRQKGQVTNGTPATPVELAPIGKKERSKRQKAAERRNEARVMEANGRDETTLSEYLPEDVNEILPKPIVGPDDSFDPGEEFLARLTRVASTEVRPPRPAPIAFATTQKEAIHANDELLRKYDFDLEKLFRAYPETTLGFGSEFRPLAQLEQVLGGHP